MSAPNFAAFSRTYGAIAILAGALLGTGCAQNQQPGYYDPPRGSTLTDSQYDGQGAAYRSVVRAPSQVQIELKPTPVRQNAGTQQAEEITEDGQAVPVNASSSAEAAPAPAATPSDTAHQLVPQPQTYLGTLPCFSPAMQCTAQRVTLTLAPNGRWRSRTAYLEDDTNQGKPVVEQGCWDATGERPPRVLLLDPKGNARAEFAVAANNVLRVRSIAGNVPNLTYSLTRQPDLDPIDELTQQAAPKCF